MRTKEIEAQAEVERKNVEDSISKSKNMKEGPYGSMRSEEALINADQASDRLVILSDLLIETTAHKGAFTWSFQEEFKMRTHARDMYHMRRKGDLWKSHDAELRQEAAELRAALAKAKPCVDFQEKVPEKGDDEVSDATSWIECEKDEAQASQLTQVKEEKGEEEVKDEGKAPGEGDEQPKDQ